MINNLPSTSLPACLHKADCLDQLLALLQLLRPFSPYLAKVHLCKLLAASFVVCLCRYSDFGTWVRAQETSNATTFKNPSFSLASAVSAYIAEKKTSVYNQRGLAHLINTNIEQEFGASAAWLSSFLYDEGANINGGDFVMPVVSNTNQVPQNLSQIPLFLATSLPAGALKLSHNVTNVAYNSTGVTVSRPACSSTVCVCRTPV